MREEVDLLEVPLVDVITAYLDDMEAAGVIGYWDDMTEFLLLMSLLVEIKSRMLLPEAFLPFEEEELTPEQARDQLLERLFVYSRFKAASLRLRDLGEASGASLLRRPLGELKILLPPVDEIVGSGSITELRESLRRVLLARSDPDTSHLVQTKVELRQQISVIKELLAAERSFSFDKVFGTQQPLVQALSVFALLDMLSRGEITVQQRRVFGDILVKSRDGEPTARGGA